MAISDAATKRLEGVTLQPGEELLHAVAVDQINASVTTGDKLKKMSRGLPQLVKELARPTEHITKGVLAATKTRAFFHSPGRGGGEFIPFPYSGITHVRYTGPSLMRREAKCEIHRAGHTYAFRASYTAFNANQEEDFAAFAAYVRSRMGEPAGAAPQPSQASANIPEQIKGLAELRDQGILTQEEFEQKKADLLKRL
jgi:hypothetical protein